jgi:predicted enzyme related to lactoylglutathione lyase
VLDLDRARKFYEKVFGYTLTSEEVSGYSMAFFPMEQGVPGAAGTLIKGETYTPSHAGTVVYFSVDDIEEVLRRVNANGGSTVLPKKSIGQYGFIAHFEDTEGNRMAVHSMK